MTTNLENGGLCRFAVCGIAQTTNRFGLSPVHELVPSKGGAKTISEMVCVYFSHPELRGERKAKSYPKFFGMNMYIILVAVLPSTS